MVATESQTLRCLLADLVARASAGVAVCRGRPRSGPASRLRPPSARRGGAAMASSAARDGIASLALENLAWSSLPRADQRPCSTQKEAIGTRPDFAGSSRLTVSTRSCLPPLTMSPAWMNTCLGAGVLDLQLVDPAGLHHLHVALGQRLLQRQRDRARRRWRRARNRWPGSRARADRRCACPGSASAAPPEAPIAANVAAARGAAEMNRIALSFLDEIAMNAMSRLERLTMRFLWPRFGWSGGESAVDLRLDEGVRERGAVVTLSARINGW